MILENELPYITCKTGFEGFWNPFKAVRFFAITKYIYIYKLYGLTQRNKASGLSSKNTSFKNLLFSFVFCFLVFFLKTNEAVRQNHVFLINGLNNQDLLGGLKIWQKSTIFTFPKKSLEQAVLLVSCQTWPDNQFFQVSMLSVLTHLLRNLHKRCNFWKSKMLENNLSCRKFLKNQAKWSK